MIYTHQQEAINYIANKFRIDPQVDALLISGSITHGFNTEESDIDINIIVSDEVYQSKKQHNQLTYWESAEKFYKNGYFDGKYITLHYLNLVARHGNEPSKFALHDSIIAFDKTGRVQNLLNKIGAHNLDSAELAIRFLSQLIGWKWYCEEAIKSNNDYLLDVSVLKLILFGGRLVLLDNRLLFPYYKWFLKVLEVAPNKPIGLLDCIQKLLNAKTRDNIDGFYNMIINYKDWAEGHQYSWTSFFVKDVELNWMSGNEFIENI